MRGLFDQIFIMSRSLTNETRKEYRLMITSRLNTTLGSAEPTCGVGGSQNRLAGYPRVRIERIF